jgi:quercetin dioxygenase-like cupin family protein
MEIGTGQSFHIPRYARHSVISLTDSVMLEVSTPHFEDRQNDDASYGVKGEENWHGDGQA